MLCVLMVSCAIVYVFMPLDSNYIFTENITVLNDGANSPFIDSKVKEKRQLFENGTFGWLWTVFGKTEEWRWRELIQSARSVHESSTKYKNSMCLITDDEGMEYLKKFPNLVSNISYLFGKDGLINFDQIPKSDVDYINMSVDSVTHTFLTKIKIMQQTPFDNTVFVDTDTMCIDPLKDIDSLFDILSSFDIATGHDWAALRGRVIPQFIVGIMPYQMNKSIRYLFNEWILAMYHHTEWSKRPSVRTQDAFRYLMVEKSKTDAILQSVRIYVYPPEVSCEGGSENTTHFEFGPIKGATHKFKLPNVRPCRFIHSHYINYKKEEFLHIYT